MKPERIILTDNQIENFHTLYIKATQPIGMEALGYTVSPEFHDEYQRKLAAYIKSHRESKYKENSMQAFAFEEIELDELVNIYDKYEREMAGHSIEYILYGKEPEECKALDALNDYLENHKYK